MRSLGIILVIVGILLAYLGYFGKVSDAFNAIKTGVVPGSKVQVSGNVSTPTNVG